MSSTIILVGIAHGVPVVIAAAITKKRVMVVLTAITMSFVAFKLGGLQYVVVDLAGIAAGAVIGWFSLESTEPTLQVQTKEKNRPSQLNNSREENIDAFAGKMFKRFSEDGLIKVRDGQEKLQRNTLETICRLYFLPDEDRLKNLEETQFFEWSKILGPTSENLIGLLYHAAAEDGIVSQQHLRLFEAGAAEGKRENEERSEERRRKAAEEISAKLQAFVD